ncbi:MAG: YdcF family protein [Myxococcales bacterium]|nr:YdcF family protein [Myxococcales bacterium]
MSSTPNDALVVLGCRVELTGELSATLRRRADWAFVAARAGLASMVVASGGRRWGDHVEAEVVTSYLVGRGLSPSAVFPELCSLTTSENALFSSTLLRRIGARRALVVTCNWHMPRALACFRALGVDALPLSVPTPPSSLLSTLYRRGHEVVASRIDRSYLRSVHRPSHPFREPST